MKYISSTDISIRENDAVQKFCRLLETSYKRHKHVVLRAQIRESSKYKYY